MELNSFNQLKEEFIIKTRKTAVVAAAHDPHLFEAVFHASVVIPLVLQSLITPWISISVWALVSVLVMAPRKS